MQAGRLEAMPTQSASGDDTGQRRSQFVRRAREREMEAIADMAPRGGAEQYRAQTMKIWSAVQVRSADLPNAQQLRKAHATLLAGGISWRHRLNLAQVPHGGSRHLLRH